MYLNVTLRACGWRCREKQLCSPAPNHKIVRMRSDNPEALSDIRAVAARQHNIAIFFIGKVKCIFK